MKVTCYCCGYSKEFADGEEAFQAGWDAPPHFTLPTCDLCPAAFYFTGIPEAHIKGHQRWQKDGRPASFEDALGNGDIEDRPIVPKRAE